MSGLKRAILNTGLLTIALIAFSSPAFPKDTKMDPNDLVTRHLQSIGPQEKLAARKTCVSEGSGTLKMLTGGTGSLTGPAVFLSDGDKFRFNMTLNFTDYPAEQFAFDGVNAQIGYIQPGRRTRLGQFLYLYNGIIKEGLLGGVLSTAWPLTQLEKRNPKLQYRGLTKIEGKPLHELKYQMKKGDSALNIYLYFEPDTFRHVATIYRLVQPNQLAGRPEDSSSQRENRFELYERFEDFREVEGLTLPFHWIIHFTSDAGTKTTITEWNLSFEKITINQPLDAKALAIQ